MVDHVSPAKRSEIMRAVHTQNTGPEILVRKLLHRAGYRFRLHRKDLPGTPDIVFPTRHKVIFVHGCYWHGHTSCPKARLPESRVEYWAAKIAANRRRDRARMRQLRKTGWRAFVVWQCQLRRPEPLMRRLKGFLGKRDA
jgi:DNA mismatch endonuclease, patch repair protein